jgi:phosphoglycerol transferase MdoB-like AlkP superfamily enzyme
VRKLIVTLIGVLAFWLLFFILARTFFLLIQFREAAGLSAGLIAGTYLYGFKHDIATASYFLLIPMLFSVAAVFVSGRWYELFLKIYNSFLIFVCLLIVTGDAFVYSYWGFRLEFSIMDYLKTPGDAMASASTTELIIFILIITALSTVYIHISNRLISRLMKTEPGNINKPVSAFVLLLLLASLIIPIRGGFGVAPLNAGSVYFTERLFPNHAAINVVWNLGHTAIYNKPQKNPYVFKDKGDAIKDLKFLTENTDSTRMVLNTDRPNIVMIILESFGSYLTDISESDSVVTPRFREYIKEGIYFSNFYAAASRTDKVLPAILSGYPCLPTINVLRDPKKTQSMPGIIKLFDSTGYKTSFWYGGNIDFANMRPYMITSGFRQRISIDDFDPSQCNSKWGVHDKILLERLRDSLLVYKSPFAAVALTLSSHEPFEVPMDDVFKGNDILSRFKNSVYYTDKSLGDFLDFAKKQDWWKNALVILLADHCRRNSEGTPVYSEDIFRIPMLWLGGALKEKGISVNNFGGQIDLSMTMARQLGLNGSFIFSKDLLDKSSKSFAFYTYNEGFAFISDSVTAIYDIKLRDNILIKGNGVEAAEKYGKSILQILFDDYLGR